MKAIAITSVFLVLRLSAQDVSLSSLGESSQINAARAYYAQTGQTNLAEVVEQRGSANIILSNRLPCTPCGGRGMIVTVIPGEVTHASRDGLRSRGRTRTSGHTGKVKMMDKRKVDKCGICGGDGKVDQIVRIVQ